MEPLFGDVGGGGAVMVGMETPQDGEGGLCSPQLVLYVGSGSEVGLLAAQRWGVKAWGGSLQPIFGDVGGGGAVMVGMETLQDGEGGSL